MRFFVDPTNYAQHLEAKEAAEIERMSLEDDDYLCPHLEWPNDCWRCPE